MKLLDVILIIVLLLIDGLAEKVRERDAQQQVAA